MYYPIIRQCIQALKNLETWLDKAEQHAAAKGFDVGVLLTSRLAPDMKDFIYQVQAPAITPKALPPGFPGRSRQSTTIPSKQSGSCVPEFEKPSISPRA